MLSDMNIATRADSCLEKPEADHREHWGLSSLPSSSVFDEKYTVLDTVGSGCYAEVKQCVKRSTQQVFAVKCCNKVGVKESILRGLHYEVAIMKTLHHPYIVQVEEVFNGDEVLYIVMEYVRGGNLYEVVTRPYHLPEPVAVEMLRNLLTAVRYIHSHRIAHCDIKPDNVLLEHPLPQSRTELRRNPKLLTAVKLADFGFARVVGEKDDLTRCCGTPYYIAPEVLKCGYFHNGPPYGRQADIWSVAVLGFVMLTGSPPFQGQKRSELFTNIVKCKWGFPANCTLSPLGRDFFQRLLVVDPKVRLTAAQALEHPWIKEAGSSKAVPLRCVQSCLSTFGFGAEATAQPAKMQQSNAIPLPPEIRARLDAKSPASPRSPPARRHTVNPLPPTASPPAAPPAPQQEAATSAEPAANKAPKKRAKKKLVVRRADLTTDLDSVLAVLEKHPSVTQIDISQDIWSPHAARKVLRMLHENRNIRLVDGPGGASVKPSQLRTVEDLVALNAARPVPSPSPMVDSALPGCPPMPGNTESR